MKDIAKMTVYGGLFLVPCIVLIISNSLFFPFITGKNFTFRIIIEVVFAAWIILAFYEPMYRPKLSWILGSFTALIGVMFFANLLGENPLQSFWSNFERMEGYVTLVHTFLYLLVMSSVFHTEKIWNRYFHTILGVAVLLAFYAFAQIAGNATIHQGGWRLDGTLGNAAYMAVYALFLTFISVFLLIRAKTPIRKYAYAAVALLFVYLLMQTATRGAMIGLVGGSFVAVCYIALFAKGNGALRKVALGGIIALIALVGLFVGLKESSFIQNSPYLERVANISLDEAKTRFTIWGMAFEGVKERSLLGWGQSNYGYVFDKYFEPSLHGQEPWFDRVHNIVMDWLIAGGVLGALAYFSIILTALYYLLIYPHRHKDKHIFSVVEQGLILGVLTGYFIHNFFVFDNIVSYIFYATMLAFIHVRVTQSTKVFSEKNIDARIVTNVVVPVVAVCCAFVVYTANVPNIKAAGDIIRALTAETPEESYEWFDTALSRGSFAQQEIREQFAQRGIAYLQTEGVSAETKQKFGERVEAELLAQLEDKPGDARGHVFTNTFYRATNQLEKAREQLAIARTLAPQKQLIMFEQGFVEIQLGEYENGLAILKEAYDLGPELQNARTNYAVGTLYVGDLARFDELISTEQEKLAFSGSDFGMRSLYHVGELGRMIPLLEMQVEKHPEDYDLRITYAYILDEYGDTQKALEALDQAILDFPTRTEQTNTFKEQVIGQ